MTGLRVGFFSLHRDPNFNFQLNRLVADGSDAMLDEVRATAPRIETLADWTREMFALADGCGRSEDEARYVRAAEFFLDADDPRKHATYERYIALFEATSTGFTRHEVPYDGGTLPALVYAPPTKRGTIVVHGGFDSFIEEFHPLLGAIRDAGYEVIAFDCPGQGAMLARHRVPMTHEWERPTSAVLDHFGASDVTLVGISLGGYLALRAAAFEPRIARVVAFDVLSDFFDCVSSRKGPIVQKAIEALMAIGARRMLDAIVARIPDPMVRWGTRQGMSVFGVTTPYAFFEHARRYSTADISSRVTQDVLILAGEDDHFVPLHQLDDQLRTLTNARSVEKRLFTRAEHASSHCQFGNLPLALSTIAAWIERVT